MSTMVRMQEEGLEPIDKQAIKILDNRGVIQEEDARLEERIDALIETKHGLEMRRLEVELRIEQAHRDYRDHGIERAFEEHASDKREIAKLRHLEFRITQECEKLKRQRSGNRTIEVNKEFMKLAKAKLGEEFYAMLRQAQAALTK